MAALGFPLVGDATYDGGRLAGVAPRLMLHAKALVLPLTGVTLEATTPDPFASFADHDHDDAGAGGGGSTGANGGGSVGGAVRDHSARAGGSCFSNGVVFTPLVQVDLGLCRATMAKAPAPLR